MANWSSYPTKANPELYAPFVTEMFGYAGEVGMELDSFLAPPNDGCTVALYNYQIDASPSCPHGETCRDVGRICAQLFDKDMDISRCVFANSFVPIPNSAVDRASNTVDLNLACCGLFPSDTCRHAATPTCRWDAAAQRGIYIPFEKEGVCTPRVASKATTACSALTTQKHCNSQPVLCRWEPAPARGVDVPLDAARCTTQAHRLWSNPGMPHNSAVLADYFIPEDYVFET